jgi:fructokinase
VQRIWVTGEALIDFVPVDASGATAYLPVCGGSTYNAAKAAARQGAEVKFIGALSTDMFGGQLAEDLAANAVDCAFAPRVPHPTTLAFVKFDGGDARYAFFNTGSATQLTDMRALACEIRPGDVLHLGSISLIDEPGAGRIVDYALAQDPGVLVSFDPNVRPGMITDRDAWARRMDTLFARADIVKLSDEDLAWIAPGHSPEDFLRDQLARGSAIVMVTLGESGALLASRAAQVRVAGHHGALVDTVGAGDTVTGSVLADFARLGLTTHASLAALGSDDLVGIARHAMAAAWLNCQSKGCAPPDRAATQALCGGQPAPI